MPFEDAVAYSRNVVAAKVALQPGQDDQGIGSGLRHVADVGFGQPTGIDLANEAAGLVRDPATTHWAQIDVANGAFGQGIAVTPVQLAQAVCRDAQRRAS